jgi:uncharacterized cupredoxin-like copper-binding protein
MKTLSLLIGAFLGVALVMAILVGATMMFVRPVANVGGVGVAPAIAPPVAAPQPAAAKPVELKVTATEFALTPSALEVPAGAPFTLTFVNKGNIDHDVTIAAATLHLAAAPGNTAEGTFTIDQPGSYEMVCSIPGHAEAGMKATLTVTGDAAQAHAHDATANAEAAHVSHASVATTAKEGNQLLPYRLEGDVKVFELKAQHVQWEVLPGELVDAYAYNGMVPGPIIRVTEGDKVKVNFTNELPEPTVIHFHGPTLPNAMDGVPDVTQPVVEPGRSFTYEFVAKPAGTFIYHTHHNSASQEPKGLYGIFQVDPKEQVGQAKPYDKELFQVLGELGGYYVINGKTFPATQALEGTVGERVLVRLINMGQMAHPMHMHGHPFQITATDGYPVPPAAVLTKDVVNIGPGERYDLLVHLDNPGTWVFHCHILTHVQNKGVEPGGMITVIKVNP